MIDKRPVTPVIASGCRSASVWRRLRFWLYKAGMVLRRRQHGFTLIEMSAVMLVISVMAAITLPRFVNMQNTARQTANTGLQNGLNSAIAIAHAQAQVDGTALDPVSTVIMDGAIVSMVYGFPDATLNGIVKAMAGLSGWTIDPSVSPMTLRSVTGGGPNCQVTYAAAQSISQPPVIGLTNKNCS